MALLPIVKYPDPRLRQATQEVADVDESIRQLVADMAETMYAGNGVGLAAIQVGSPHRIFLIEASAGGGNENDPPLVFINPRVEELSRESETDEEGCLSFPGIFIPVKRSLRARFSAVNLDGKRFVVEGEGLFARAMQHEFDHLEGRLLIDHAGPMKRRIIQRRLEKQAEDAAEGEEAEPL